MNMKKALLLFTLGILLIPKPKAQGIGDFMDAYFGDNAVPYIQPLADIFTANANTGIYEWSHIDTSFYFRIRATAIYSWPSAESRTFTAVTPDHFEPQQFVDVPTIVGDNEAISAPGLNETYYVFAPGYNVDLFPYGAPQITVGGFLNSEISARFLTFPIGEDIGDIQFWGIGARHAISHYLNNFPVDLSVGYFYHHFELEDNIISNHHLVSAHVGKTGKWWSAGLMVGYQQTDFTADYLFDHGDSIEEVHMELSNENPFIVELTAGVKLGIIGIHTSASYAELFSASVGIGLYF